MQKRILTAGDSVESQCTRCKALLNHTIVAMVAGEVVRVKCNTCGSEHNHRPAKPAKVAQPKTVRAASGATRPAASRSTKTQGPSDEAIWEEAIKPHDPDRAVPYRMDGSFQLNSLLTHPTFGIGLVAVRQAGKVEVIFKSGRKLLRAN